MATVEHVGNPNVPPASSQSPNPVIVHRFDRQLHYDHMKQS